MKPNPWESFFAGLAGTRVPYKTVADVFAGTAKRLLPAQMTWRSVR